jgi:hypothetical protein
MLEHRLVGHARKPPFAELLRFVAPAGIERSGGAANDILGAVGYGGITLSFRGVAQATNPESRDSGSGPSDHPGMTIEEVFY